MVAVESGRFEPVHAELVAAAMRQRRPDRALLTRARAGREAVMMGGDPALTLALVVWPNETVTDAETSVRDASLTHHLAAPQ